MDQKTINKSFQTSLGEQAGSLFSTSDDRVFVILVESKIYNTPLVASDQKILRLQSDLKRDIKKSRIRRGEMPALLSLSDILTEIMGIFKMEYKGIIIHRKIIEIPDYAKGIIDDENMSFFYFFKDVANQLEEKINEEHKKKMWEDLNKNKK